MKNILTIILVWIPLFSFSQVVTDGLVGYWPFNGNALDESGQYAHGEVLGGATLTADRFGNANSAYFFDGLDDYIRIANPYSEFSANEMTISVWMNFESFQIGGGLGQSAENINNWATTSWLVAGWPAGYRLPPNSFQFAVSGGGSSYPNTNTSTMSPGVWMHFIFKYDGNEISIYKDGVKVAGNTATTSSIVNNPSSVIHIGKDSRYASGRWYKGMIDDVAIYNRALTDAEIAQLYGGDHPEDGSPGFELCNNLYCNDNGVGIGTTSIPYDYMLAVNGKAIMEEVKVQLNTEWPDYIFDRSYALRPLAELEQYIKENKHLPEIPSEAEVKENGINLGEMDAKLLLKIEELTLYLLQVKKEADQLRKENQQLKQGDAKREELINQLISRIEKLEQE